MTVAPRPSNLRQWRPGPWAQLLIALSLALASALALIGPDRLIAQIEGDRGFVPVATSSDIQIGGIEVETTGKDANEARQNGWKLAQRMGWQMLKGPNMSDDQIESMVAAVVIEHEQIGPHRYIAKLGVVFDREKAGQFLVSNQGGNAISRSAPLLVIPVLYSGGVAQVFEVRNAWQKAWAEARVGNSSVDYVRPTGAGGDSLILTAGQPGRRSRLWWRTVLNQFGASDVISPVARLERQWPGGPVRATFTARYGPDNTYLDSFALTANDETGVPGMLNQAIERLDRIYSDAVVQGLLRPDPTLYSDQQTMDAALASLVAAIQPKTVTGDVPAATASGTSPDGAASEAPPREAAVSSYTVQFASPDAQAVDAALGAVRSAAGIKSAATSSIAIGGTSVMRVSYAGELGELAAALRARGWQVTVGSNSLSIRR
ncbi:MAG: heavy-metal-associated domain-containing protein [Novosphingobium sp.]